MLSSVIILAGGIGSRLLSNTPKQFHSINGKTILQFTYEIFANRKDISNIVVVYNANHSENDVFKNLGKAVLIKGGNNRQESVYNGLKHLSEIDGVENVLITDVVRPLVNGELIESLLLQLENSQTAIPVGKIFDTLFSCKGNKIIDRNEIVAIQTPQAFKFNLIWDLHQKYRGLNFSDDSSLCIKEGLEIKTVENPRPNIKITTQDDLKLVKFLLENK